MNHHAARYLQRARFAIGFLLAAALWAPGLHALTITSAATGNWNAVATWAIVTTGIPGTISTVNGSATVTGTGTEFLKLKGGDQLYTNASVLIGTISTVASDTSLTLTAVATANRTNVTYRIRKVPDANDSANVGTTATHVVTIPAGYAAQVNGLTIGATTTNDAAVTLANATASLSAGAVSINRTSSTPRTHSLNVNAGSATLASVTITGGAGSRAGQLAISTGTATISGALTFAGTASNARVTFSGAGLLRVGGTFGTGGTLTASTGTVEYNGAAQSVQTAYSYYNLSLSGTGTKTPAAGTLTVGGSLTLNSGVTYAGATNNPAVNIAGSFSDSGTFNSGTGLFTFNGTAAQALSGSNPDTTFTNLRMNNSGGATLTLNHNAVVNGTLTFSNGKIATAGANAVVIGTAGTIATPGTSSYVVGNFRKTYSAGASLNYVGDDFPVGDATSYTPVNITAGTTSTAGTLTVSTTATDHPQVTTPIASTGIDAALSVNRYWTFVSNNVTASPVSATFYFINPGDLDAGTSTWLFIVQRYDQTLWHQTTLNAASVSNTQVSDIALATGTHDFAIGQPLPGGAPAPVGRFNVFESTTAAGALEGKIYTKQAGVPVSDLDIIHVNPSKTNYQGGSVTVEIQLLDATTGGATDADGCSTTDSWPVVQTLPNHTFTSRGTLPAFTVADAYRNLRFRVRYPVGGPYSQIGCSQDNFAVRPSSLTISARDNDWLTATPATRVLNNVSATGGNVHAAGRPFTLRVVAEPNATVTLYNGTPTFVAGSPGCGTLCTSAGNLSVGAWGGSGTRDATAQYAEAGTLMVQLEDATWSAVDDFDGSTADMRIARATGNVAVEIGRFVPDHFQVSATGATPTFRTFDQSCTGARTFTYIGSPFGYATAPSVLIEARNAAGVKTGNYRGVLWKIGAGAASAAKDCSVPNICTFTTSWPSAGKVIESYEYTLNPVSTPGWDATLSATATASVVDNSNGTGTVTFDNAGRLAFARATGTPQVPFTAAIKDTISVQDDSEVAAGNGTIGTGTSAVFNPILFDVSDSFRYGRLRLQNTLASSGALAARMPIEAQYWSSSGFFVASDDSCTSFAAGDFILAPTLSGGATSITGGPFTLSGGKSTLTLSGPGAANKGFVTVTANLTAAFPWLQGAWPGPSYNQNPSARATWGLFGSQPRNFIFQRENY